MQITLSSRRYFLANSMSLLGAGLPLAGSGLREVGTTAPDPAQVTPAAGRPLSVVCLGAHPDDPESGCGGTLIRYASAGHHVTIMYLTRGERGIKGKTLDEAAAIRTAECEAACKIIGARPVFVGQIDGASEASLARSAELSRLLDAEQPDVVFTQWPQDSHMDHLVTAILTIHAWTDAARKFSLYFYEVDAGEQTVGFMPTDYVDVTAVRERKKAALFCHKSQNGEQIYRQHHEIMESFRGRDAGVTAAEAFVHFAPSDRRTSLPG